MIKHNDLFVFVIFDNFNFFILSWITRWRGKWKIKGLQEFFVIILLFHFNN